MINFVPFTSGRRRTYARLELARGVEAGAAEVGEGGEAGWRDAAET
jgi:hypothetical protein